MALQKCSDELVEKSEAASKRLGFLLVFKTDEEYYRGIANGATPSNIEGWATMTPEYARALAKIWDKGSEPTQAEVDADPKEWKKLLESDFVLEE
ncbi:Uu.00g095390.m01.CDS01 [Anthostomella pinea]|uniref:Uu.00g095390.m01.CDS01 n=1 Tax=Anthostomella pinea TaxID=933095 RepID=A0AAI8VTQ0_9PEZI|nr:Uu.00g095390.m01.CDS01 [Anthostomella pinea]